MAYQIPTSLSPIQPSRIPVAVSPPRPYVVLKELGKGAFGKVSKVKRTSDGKLLAMKQIKLRKMDKNAVADLENETRIHCSLDHPHIVKIDSFEYDDKKEHMQIYMDLCEGGDLDDYINEHRKLNEPLDEEIVWKLFAQLVQALHYCHDPSSREDGSTKAIIHRDLKPANIFMTKDRTQIRLGDFGIARELEMNEYAKTDCGTDAYLAPEVHKYEEYNQSADIFSLGAIIFELCTLKYLVPEDSDHPDARQQILAGVDPTIPSRYSPELRAVVRNMLSSNAMERYSTTELLGLNGINWGLTLKTCDKDQKALKVVHKQLRSQKDKAAQLENRVRELEQKLEQAQHTVKTRTAALDIRERALNTREANLASELAQTEAKIKKDLAARERQLRQDRLAFTASSRRAAKMASPSAQELESTTSSERSSGSATTNTASAVSSALRCSIAATSTSASHSQKDASLACRQSNAAQPNAQALHRAPKRYNLRSQAATVTDTSSKADTKMVSMLPKRKLRSDGDLSVIALGSDNKENNESILPVSAEKSSCIEGKSIPPHQLDANKNAARNAKAAKPSGIPIYHLRSAAKRNGALELRRAGL